MKKNKLKNEINMVDMTNNANYTIDKFFSKLLIVTNLCIILIFLFALYKFFLFFI